MEKESGKLHIESVLMEGEDSTKFSRPIHLTGESVNNRLLVNTAETAKLLSMSRSGLYEFISTGRFGVLPVRFGSRRLYSVKELTDYVSAGCPARDVWQRQKGNR